MNTAGSTMVHSLVNSCKILLLSLTSSNIFSYVSLCITVFLAIDLRRNDSEGKIIRLGNLFIICLFFNNLN